jgi:CheY-like chemotaxis protein
MTETQEITVLLVDDQPLLRMGFRLILEGEDDLRIVGEASDGAEAVRLVRELNPDVVLMDVRMPVLDGIAATREIASDRTKVLILTTFDLDDYVYDSLAAGASGFLLKDAGPEHLTEAIRVVARRAHAARARGAAARGGGALERGDRRAARGRGDDRQDARVAAIGEARPPRPRPGGDPRLRDSALRRAAGADDERRERARTTRVIAVLILSSRPTGPVPPVHPAASASADFAPRRSG